MKNQKNISPITRAEEVFIELGLESLGIELDQALVELGNPELTKTQFLGILDNLSAVVESIKSVVTTSE